MARHLDWEGCFNARDLGGLKTAAGDEIRRGAAVRADALDALTARGWEAVVAHGVTTIIDLRNDDELGADAAPRPEELTTLRMPLDQVEDTEFWAYWSSGWQFGTPLYYGPHIARFPRRSAGVIAAIARAAPGGVVVHCGVGRDRTGLVTMLLLALLGVSVEEIAADYALSTARLPPLFARRGEPDQGPLIEAFFAEQATSASAVIAKTLADLDHEAWMRDGGLTEDDLARLRARLLR
ncbi:MAG: tyrosine-protein phosphatase [Labilithrix sp.]|nr:tyrosine-protein phosphatase [Labilithrix sp.]